MKKIKKPQIALPRFMRSRWFIIGLVAAVVLGGIGGYLWWSQSSWNAYEKKYTSLRQDIDTKLTTVFTMQSDTGQQRQEKTASLAKISADIEVTGDSFCHQNALIGWQRVFNEYKTYEGSCRDTLALARAFNDQLKVTVEYLQQEQALARQMAAAPSQTEVAEGDFEAQLGAWRSVYEGIRNTNVSGDLDPVKQATLGVTGEIMGNWGEIIAAHQAKDKARYTKAIQALAAAYDKLGTVSSTNREQLKGVAARLKEAYQELQ